MSNQEALAKIEDVGVIARVSPEHKGSLPSKWLQNDPKPMRASSVISWFA